MALIYYLSQKLISKNVNVLNIQTFLTTQPIRVSLRIRGDFHVRIGWVKGSWKTRNKVSMATHIPLISVEMKNILLNSVCFTHFGEVGPITIHGSPL